MTKKGGGSHPFRPQRIGKEKKVGGRQMFSSRRTHTTRKKKAIPHPFLFFLVQFEIATLLFKCYKHLSLFYFFYICQSGLSVRGKEGVVQWMSSFVGAIRCGTTTTKIHHSVKMCILVFDTIS
jgi:hypothetical protein